MLDMQIRTQIEKLDSNELRQLYNWIRKLLPPSVVYQQKPTKCGCKKCKEGGKGHGLYWYAYFTYQNKTYCIYLGKEKREIDPLEVLSKKGEKGGY